MKERPPGTLLSTTVDSQGRLIMPADLSRTAQSKQAQRFPCASLAKACSSGHRCPGSAKSMSSLRAAATLHAAPACAMRGVNRWGT